MAKLKELRGESTERLREMVTETKDKLFKYRLRIAAGEEVNSHEAREMRRDIARMKTVVRSVELAAERAGVDADAARKGLETNNWDVKRAVAALGRERAGSA